MARAHDKKVHPLTNKPKNKNNEVATLSGEVENNFKRFVKKAPSNSKDNITFKQLKNGDYLFEAISPGKVPGSKAIYQKWVNPNGETFKMIKTTIDPDGNIIHQKHKY